MILFSAICFNSKIVIILTTKKLSHPFLQQSKTEILKNRYPNHYFLHMFFFLSVIVDCNMGINWTSTELFHATISLTVTFIFLLSIRFHIINHTLLRAVSPACLNWPNTKSKIQWFRFRHETLQIRRDDMNSFHYFRSFPDASLFLVDDTNLRCL